MVSDHQKVDKGWLEIKGMAIKPLSGSIFAVSHRTCLILWSLYSTGTWSRWQMEGACCGASELSKYSGDDPWGFCRYCADERSCQKLCVVTWPRSLKLKQLPRHAKTARHLTSKGLDWQTMAEGANQTVQDVKDTSTCRQLFQVSEIVWDDEGPAPVVHRL